MQISHARIHSAVLLYWTGRDQAPPPRQRYSIGLVAIKHPPPSTLLYRAGRDQAPPPSTLLYRAGPDQARSLSFATAMFTLACGARSRRREEPTVTWRRVARRHDREENRFDDFLFFNSHN